MKEPNLNERIKSAATPRTAGSMEEREAIVAHLESKAQRLQDTAFDPMQPSIRARITAWQEAAREIRDGAHHEEQA